jgi:serine/threonine protein kinase
MDSKRGKLTLDFSKIAVEPQINVVPTNAGILTFPEGQTYEFNARNLIDKGIIGSGSYGGVVNKMEHDASGKIMAVKRVRARDVEKKERDVMLRELKMIIDSQGCEDVVRFYGALFEDGDCWICMEIMDCSLDKFYRQVYKQNERIPEKIIGFITASVVRALNYLKETLNLIHRDIKPSNILLNTQGFVKLCDFGISGYLVDSIAKTQDVGCQIYMAVSMSSLFLIYINVYFSLKDYLKEDMEFEQMYGVLEFHWLKFVLADFHILIGILFLINFKRLYMVIHHSFKQVIIQ